MKRRCSRGRSDRNLPGGGGGFHLQQWFRNQLKQNTRLEMFKVRNLHPKKSWEWLNGILGGGFKYVLFSPLFGENSHFDHSNIFELG